MVLWKLEDWRNAWCGFLCGWWDALGCGVDGWCVRLALLGLDRRSRGWPRRFGVVMQSRGVCGG